MDRRELLFVMICLLPSLLFGRRVSVMVGSPAQLTCERPCHGDLRWTKPWERLLVAECEQQDCEEGEAFKNRTKVSQQNASLLLDCAEYEDAGWYLCCCNGSVMCRRRLKVKFPPITMSASVGEKVTLPCHTRTDKNTAGNVELIQWKKKGKLVVKLQGGKLSYGPGFEQRASVSADRCKAGDLSLDLTLLDSSDEGIYRCFRGNKTWASPKLYLSKVEDFS